MTGISAATRARIASGRLPLDLDRLGATLLDEAERVRHRRLGAEVERTVGHVGHEKSPFEATADGAHMVQRLVHRQ